MQLFNTTSQLVWTALNKSLAIIEFGMDGVVLGANENFCRLMGYSPAEIVGSHHSMFVDKSDALSPDYQNFWAKLNKGEFDHRLYKRIAKNGREVWIEASYNPVMRSGKPIKVVKVAYDVTERQVRAADHEGKVNAIERAQAAIEFTPLGVILDANQNFLDAMGYTAEEIRGRHHSIFCQANYTESDDYRTFWSRLAQGSYIADEFLRIGKNGKKVYIQATYNPIFDASGRVYKVVKFATDVSQRVQDVEALAQALGGLSGGDLTQRLEVPFIRALEPLRTDFNLVTRKLHDSMSAIAENASAIAAASQQIRNASDDLYRRTEQQAASVEETAAALEEITTTVTDSSQRAHEAGTLARMTKENAERSGIVVGQAIEAMGRIESSASEIANIIGVIDEIAFQTNLLALNAGVEAARAGDAGKGFAVVAQEVRELAQRSAKAAKEIKGLITASNEHVNHGVAYVNNTGKALSEIVTQVVQVDSNVAAIVDASREQATGLQEINTAVNTIDQGTQQNAAMVEETSAASHSLAKEAEELFQQLSKFRLHNSIRHHDRSAPTMQQGPQSRTSDAPRLRPKLVRAHSGNNALSAESWEEF
ncbi:MAG: PAS domain-containing methyl-accepting chemotaxis protein [Rhizobium sp.]|nr:PAS domain-containing methyl-accepting chemotaxis protein [Rhizobium sp.]